jgi:hypothetical protein
MSNYDSLYLTGTQQVSIFPYQTLSSVYGNEVLYGLFEPGIYNSGVTLSDGSSNTMFRVSINAGTTLLFKRSHVNPDDPTITDTILGKIVVTSPNFIDQLKANIWKDVGAFASATKLYVLADWRYGITSSSERYVDFSLATDLSGVLEGTTSHKIVVATLSNHQWFVDNENYSSTNSNLYNYHISYETQANRDPLKRLYVQNDNYNLVFAHNGRSVTINPGKAWIGASMASLTTTQVVAPAVGLTTYISSTVTNTPVLVAGSESNYYQVDFLRVKVDENSSALVYGWDSFLVTGTGTGSLSGASLGWANNSITQQQLLTYIQQFRYPIKGDGLTLLVSVRPRSDVPPADGATNILWPEQCVIWKDQAINANQLTRDHSRLKVPVWQSSDLGYI